MRLDRTAVLHFSAQVVRSLAGFGTTLLAARYFGAAGLGIYSQVLALHFWLKLPSNSLKSAISKRMSESEETVGHFSAGLLATLLYGFFIGGALLVFEESVNAYLNIEGAHLLALLLVVNMVVDIARSGFVGRKRVALSGWLGTAEQVLRIISQVSFVLSGAMVVGLVWGHIFSLFIFAIIGLFLLRDHLTLPTRSDIHEIRTFAQYSWLGNLQGLSLTWMDILVLGIFVSNDSVGIYQAAWTLASFLALTSKSISQTLYPELSDLGTSEKYERARELINNALVFAGIFLIPGIFGAYVIGDRVLTIYRAEFAAGTTILVLLICARTVYTFGSQFVSALNGLDYPDIAFRINFVFIIVNVVGNLTLVYLIGWYGAALATMVSTIVYFALSWYMLQNTLGGIEIPVTEVAYQFGASIVMATILSIILPKIPKNDIVTVTAVFGGAAIYATVLLLLSERIRSKIIRLSNIK